MFGQIADLRTIVAVAGALIIYFDAWIEQFLKLLRLVKLILMERWIRTQALIQGDAF